MGLLSPIGKFASFSVKSLVSDSKSVINARKALYGVTKEGKEKGFEFIFTNFVPKAKAGLKEFVKEYNSTNPAETFKSFKGGINLFRNAVKTAVADGIKNVAPEASSFVKFLGGAKGLWKGVSQACKKVPIIGTLLITACEAPEIYKAFKNGGLSEGTKQIFKSTSKLLVGAACSAACTAIAGPIGGMAGWAVGDWLASKIVGKSYSEKKAEAEAEQKAQEESQQNQQQAPQPATSYTYPPQGYTYPQQTFGNNSALNNPYQNDIFMNQLPFNTVA